MKRNDFPRDAKLTEAWRKLGVPTNNINQATRWHDKDARVWTLWIENPNGVNFEVHDKGAKLVLTPWELDREGHSAIHKAKARKYWIDLHEAAVEGSAIRILAIKWRRDIDNKFVEEPFGATIPVYWREMLASMHEDGTRIVLTQAVVEPPK
jgi:hypothetical protein